MVSTLHNFQNRRGQRGAVLAVGLIFLVLLTMLGLTAMQMTTMEERMAGNSRDRSVAFQAAESGLRDGEQFLVGKDFYAFNPTCTGALCTQGSAPDWRSYAWDGGKDVSASTIITGLFEQPRFFSEYVGQIKCPECSGGWRSAYRLTVRAKGANSNTVIFLDQVQRP